MYLSARDRLILDILLRPEENISQKQIAAQLNVSSRTIHRDLDRLQSVVNEYNLTIEKKPEIILSGDSENKRKLKENLKDVELIEVTSEERKSLIIAKLLDASEPIKLVVLTNELNVSIVTISNDLKDLESWFDHFKLELVRKRSYGVEVIGEEKTKRLALMHLFSEMIPEDELISVVREKPNLDFSAITKRILKIVGIDYIKNIRDIFNYYYKQLPYTISDNAYSEIVIYLALMLARIKKAMFIKEDNNHLPPLKGSKEYNIALEMVKEYEDVFEVNISEAEIGELTIHLQGAKLRYDEKHNLEAINLMLTPQIKALIKNVDKKMSSHLYRDYIFFQGLSIHLERAIYRIKNQMKIHNPLLDQIKERYEDLFFIIREAVDRTFSKLNFPDDEIGFLVMHFGSALQKKEKKKDLNVIVVCSSGMGSSKMLASRLKTEIPEVSKVSTTSLLDLPKFNFHAYDLVLSTVPLPLKDEDYIIVNPLLAEEEADKVREAIYKDSSSVEVSNSALYADSTKKQNYSISKTLLENFKEINYISSLIIDFLETFQFSNLKDEKTMENVLYQASELLDEKKIVSNSSELVFDLKKQEVIGGVGIPNTGIAFYHCRTKTVNKPSFSLFRLEEPIKSIGMDNNPMLIYTILILLAPEDIDDIGLYFLSFVSTLVIESNESTYLFERGNAEQVLSYLSKNFDEYLQLRKWNVDSSNNY